MNGLMVVYTYFQIPLMVIIFLPALGGLRREWWEASSSLGGSGWRFWRHVGGPILAPSFLGALLLLFANAFSAYATAAALVSQGSPIVPLRIRGALTSEVVLGQANVGKALALGMIVVVAIVMLLYALAPAARFTVGQVSGGRRTQRPHASPGGPSSSSSGGTCCCRSSRCSTSRPALRVAGARSTRGWPSARTRTSSRPSSSRSRSPR